MANPAGPGFLLIPDITGFTEFVNQVDLVHGQHITMELLDNLIKNNTLNLILAEVEGDALLFYRMGQPPSLNSLMKQVIRWFEQFHITLKRLNREIFCHCGACRNVGSLSLKVVGHFGEIGSYELDGRTKIFGTDVILPHRLLKNSVNIRDYFLFTNALLENAAGGDKQGWNYFGHRETYPVFGELNLSYFNLGPYISNLPPSEPLDDLPKLPGYFREAGEIDVPLALVVDHLTDFDKWLLWVRGISSMDFNRQEALRHGHHHRCIIDGNPLEQTLESIEEQEKLFRMILRVKPKFPVRENWIVYTAKMEQGKVVFSMEFYFEIRAPFRRIMERFVLPKVQAGVRGSIRNLKNLLESGEKPPTK